MTTGIDELEERLDKKELDEKDWKILKMLVGMWRSIRYEHIVDTPFICGVSGEKGQDGLPERFLICPTYGLDGFAIYKKEKDYDAPGW